jgi:carbon starvation protein
MNSLILIVTVVVLYVIAYNTYGKFIAKKLFGIREDQTPPSRELEDGVDYVPTKKSVLFGHHFASIAGTGPIIGPAIGILWGWVPAILWVIFGSIFMGAVHDFGALFISMRSKGNTIGSISGDVINRRAKMLFLLIIFFTLLIVIAIFGVVIGACFAAFPHSVFPVWMQIPIAVTLGWLVYKKNMPSIPLTIIAVVLMYATIAVGAYLIGSFTFPTITIPGSGGTTLLTIESIGGWVIVLLIYSYIASILPVQTLLQPRDFINAYQLFIAMVLLALGVIIAHPVMVAPSMNINLKDAPSFFPFLFVTIACGAVSGFHSLVSSGTSSKQCGNEKDSLFIGYGSMLTEGLLAAFVLVACGAGVGMAYNVGGVTLTGIDAFNQEYGSWAIANSGGLQGKLSSFIIGSTNMIAKAGIPAEFAITLMGVFIVSFAATTLDSATRIQRYIISEIALTCKAPFFAKKHPATLIAVGSAFILAFYKTKFTEGGIVMSGTGAFTLWPLFGSANQLLAGLSLLVITVYLMLKKKPFFYTGIPMIIMIVISATALILEIKRFALAGNYMLAVIGTIIIILELWMIVESILVLTKVEKKLKGKVS